MTSSEYQNKIISLLDDLANILYSINNVLEDIIWQSTYSSKSVLKENETDQLRDKLESLIIEAWDIINDLDTSIKTSVPFEDVGEVSKKVFKIVLYAKNVNTTYNIAKEENLLDAGLITNKKTLLKSLEDISNHIIEYNKNFSPKIKTLKVLLSETGLFMKQCNEQLYEEIFHEKFSGTKYQKKRRFKI